MPHSKLATSVALSVALSASAASSQTELLFWNQGDASVRDYSQVVIDTFAQTHPEVEVALEIYPNEPYKTAIQVVMGAGSQPDVFFNWAGEDAGRFARAGRVLDLAELGEGRWNDVVSPGLLTTYNVEGIQAGVPFSQHTSLFYYNTAIFEEHGLTPPATMDELIGLCGRLQEVAPGTIPLVLGAREPWTVNHYITMLFTRFVPEEVRAADYSLAAESDALFTDPRYVEALGQLVALQSEGCFNEGANSVSPEEARSLFAVGAAAMTYCGTWCLGPIDREGLEGGYNVFPMPSVTGADGDQEAIFSVVTGLQIAAATAHPEVAADFIAHYVGPEMQAEMYRRLQRLPVNPAALEQLDLPPVVAQIVRDMATATSASMPLDVELEASVSQAVLNIGQELLNGTTTPEAAMETVRQAALAASAAN
jgi:raffinose/stachyose/melibiose transport system substrate-binding protein